MNMYQTVGPLARVDEFMKVAWDFFWEGEERPREFWPRRRLSLRLRRVQDTAYQVAARLEEDCESVQPEQAR